MSFLRIHRSLECHPAHLALVRHRGDQAQALPTVIDPDDRGLAPRGVAAAAHIVRAQPRLVPPVNLGPLALGPFRDRWVVRLQPALDLCRTLFVGTPDRLLWRKTPALEVVSDRTYRKQQSELGLDQLSNRHPVPQRKLKLQLIRGFLDNHPSNRPFLLRRQRAPVADPTPAALHRHRLPSATQIGLMGCDDRRCTELGLRRDLGQFHPAQAKLDRAPTTLVEYINREVSRVLSFHASNDTTIHPNS